MLEFSLHTCASRSIRMNCESLPSAMIGDTVPDPDRELRSVVRSTQDPENEVGVSDIVTILASAGVSEIAEAKGEVHLGSVQLRSKR